MPTLPKSRAYVLLADADRWRLLRWTLEQGATLVPAQHYHELDYGLIGRLRDLS